MKVLQEVTSWDLEYQPNHVYYVRDNGKLWGYKPRGEGEVRILKTELPFDRARRKFITLETIDEPQKDNTIEIVGSKGDKYYVTFEDDKANCTCKGFTFRGHCKHIEEANKK